MYRQRCQPVFIFWEFLSFCPLPRIMLFWDTYFAYLWEFNFHICLTYTISSLLFIDLLDHAMLFGYKQFSYLLLTRVYTFFKHYIALNLSLCVFVSVVLKGFLGSILRTQWNMSWREILIDRCLRLCRFVWNFYMQTDCRLMDFSGLFKTFWYNVALWKTVGIVEILVYLFTLLYLTYK